MPLLPAFRRGLGSMLAVWLIAISLGADAAQNPPNEASPAAQPPPPTATPQQYPPALVEAGRARFGADCGFCHGRDAAGGAGGTDLTRSALVAADVRGDRIGPVVRAGRPQNGMPAFALSASDLDAVVAFVHAQKAQADQATGGRRRVDESDLQTGNAEAGRRYFEAVCVACHSSGGDLAGIASRLRGLSLLQQMLYPGSAGRDGGTPPDAPTITVTLPSGQSVKGREAYRDEFTVAITDADGWYRSWSTRDVTFTVDDPLQTHVEQLSRYTDADMHNVLAYLQTLR